MPKKINHIYSYRQDNAYSTHNLTNSSKIAFSRENRQSRENRTNVGSVFSNESSQFSLGGGKDIPSATATHQHQSKEKENNNKVSSNDNISINIYNDNEQFSETSKHISFVLFKERENKSLTNSVNRFGSGVLNDPNDNEPAVNRLSAGAVISKTGPVASSLQNQDHIKSASITHINQKRNSIKISRRPSLKYRSDRSHRSNMNSMNTSTLSRKLSHATSLCNSEDKQDFENNQSFANPASNANIDDILIISEEGTQPTNSHNQGANVSSHANGVTFCGVTPNYPTQTEYNQQQMFNDACDVDEIDFNRCFPWIKIVIKLFNAISFDCGHFTPNHFQSGNQIQIKNRRHLLENCSKDCYLKLFKNSHSLIEAVLRMYETSSNLNLFEKYEKQLEQKNKENLNQSKKYAKEDRAMSSSKNRKVRNFIFILVEIISSKK